MSEVGITFDSVWKKFRRGELHDSLRDLIPALTRRILRRGKPAPALEQREFWALQDVSFEVRPGEALGIIGANGAGKSTVLKLLNRILRPTRGVCEVRGRVGALIEVSAGFHPDLTGRQNVFLQGAIRGMNSADTLRKFDQIVDFAGIADFIDTPVKRYSSGMNARLGFSIAAHLDPEVLIIDEVLAVGDLSFQDRAFGRIRDLATSGIPVVIVSHQLERIATLCSSVILLDRGRIAKQDTAEACIAAYVMNTTQHTDSDALGSSPVRIEELHVMSALPVRSGDTLRYRIKGVVEAGPGSDHDPFFVRIRSAQTGKIVFATAGANCGMACPPPGPFEAEIELQMNLGPGIYAIETIVRDTARSRIALKGPMTYVQVSRGAVFEGSVQLNAQMRAVEALPAGTAARIAALHD